jgi:hypothetical protein
MGFESPAVSGCGVGSGAVAPDMFGELCGGELAWVSVKSGVGALIG